MFSIFRQPRPFSRRLSVCELDSRDLPATFTIANGNVAGLIAAIKTANSNVSPAEVELEMQQLDGVHSAYVVGIPDVERGQLLVAAVVPGFQVGGFGAAMLVAFFISCLGLVLNLLFGRG